ncbi:MAG: hypothetical protein C4339_02225 [Nitrososphaerota archaeon]
MKLLQKRGDEVLLLCSPREEVSLGEYLSVSDGGGRALIVQAYEQSYLEYPGMLEELVREEIVESLGQGEERDPLEIRNFNQLLRDLKLVRCKVRGVLSGGRLSLEAGWLPSRSRALVRRVSMPELLRAQGVQSRRPLKLGEAQGEEHSICWEDLDGKLTLILGRKETGKSHLAKLLATGLVQAGAGVLVFDINNEYLALTKAEELEGRAQALTPSSSLLFSLQGLGLGVMVRIVEWALETPAISVREFARLWRACEAEGRLTLDALLERAEQARMNEHVREALVSRLLALRGSRLFSEWPKPPELSSLFYREGGQLTVLALRHLSRLQRRILVEALLGKALELLSLERIPPIFVLAEEAHLYLGETHWDDLITRMRHYGIFPIFVTNQPDAVPETVYRQLDNLFLFNVNSERDVERISACLGLDAQSTAAIAKGLPMGHCLIVGLASHGLPVVSRIRSLGAEAGGATRSFLAWQQKAIKQSTS